MKKIILINFILIISFFLIFEIFLRVFNLSSLRGMSEYYFFNNKNIEGKAFGIKFFTDEYGFRVPQINYKYNSKNKNIILIGDSFVFGPGVKEVNTFAGKLRKYKTTHNVFNSSRPGNNLNDYFNDVKFFTENFEENQFYIFLNFDDIKFYKNQNIKSEVLNKKFQSIRDIKILNKINIFLRSRLYSYIWLVSVTTNPIKRYYDASEYLYKEKSLINQFSDDILKITNYIANKNSRVVFLITPYNYQIKKNCNQKNLTPQKKLSEVFKINKINFYDFTGSFCSENIDLFIKFDPTHLSKKGHEIVYNYLKKK
ncbi:MAG: hypothetical protein CBD76_03005 [Pelagibacteraceae bacterium TMED216]|nr:MAG: hypothetical protein CBD76_03005 [Pelagibacteraceae bacterium TMED216]